MTASTRPRGIDLRLSLILGILLVVAIGGTAVYAVGTRGDLDRTAVTLSTTTATLDSTKSDLAAAERKLAQTKTDLDQQGRLLAAATTKVPMLEEQISRKGVCITAQSGNLTELHRILDLQRQNFARTTKTSAWRKESDAGQKALDLAITDLYRAWQNAAAGKLSAANSWIRSSNAQISTANARDRAGNLEVKRTNAATDAINTAQDAFQKKLDATIATCGA